MLRTRVIPCLQLIDEALVKTVKFNNHKYIGDPINTVRIFNELEVDELCFLDIRATKEKRKPNFKILREIADECFMPLSYGGGINDEHTVSEILSIGFEKVVLNTTAFTNQNLISKIAKHFGSQSIIASIDVKKNLFNKYHVYTHDGTKKQAIDPVEYAKMLENTGAGEILLTSIDNEGTWSGYDIEITKAISKAVRIPVIANGGCGSVQHIKEVVSKANVSAVALGSMVVYQRKNFGVLVNFPDKVALQQALEGD